MKIEQGLLFVYRKLIYEVINIDNGSVDYIIFETPKNLRDYKSYMRILGAISCGSFKMIGFLIRVQQGNIVPIDKKYLILEKHSRNFVEEE